MKKRFVIPLVTLFAIASSTAFAQPDPKQMDQRFQTMEQMMGQAQSAHGAERAQLMQQHMKLMQEQMQSMHSMMGGMGGNMGAGMSGNMSAGDMMGWNGTNDGDADHLQQMQSRMDMMQRMMEQMLNQQNMMMQQQQSK